MMRKHRWLRAYLNQDTGAGTGGAPAEGTGAPPANINQTGGMDEGGHGSDWNGVVPAKFLGEDGQPNVQSLAESYTNLERLIGKRMEKVSQESPEFQSALEAYANQQKDQLREEIRKEFQTAPEGVPSSPDDYELKLEGDDLPTHVEIEFDPNDELTIEARKMAHEMGMTQEQFNRMTSHLAKSIGRMVPDVQAEKQKLGERAEDRIAHVNQWAEKNLEPEVAEQLKGICTTAGAFEAVEALVNKVTQTREQKLNQAHVRTGSPVKTEADLRAMMNDPRYLDPGRRDPDYVKMVDDEFRKAYPSQTRR